MLSVARLHCAYGNAAVLRDVSLSLGAGQLLCLLGRNGAGKTTTLKAIMGLIKPRSGRITLDDIELVGRPAHEVARLGIAFVPQGRRLFPSFTVEENLRMGLLLARDARETLDWVLELFPALKERLDQRAGTLSGGEQQMLATARAMCARPKVLLMDEPSEGLMPSVVLTLLDALRTLKANQVGILLVEQRIDAALEVADRVALMENGSVQYESTPGELVSNPEVLLRYVGVRR